VPKSYYILKANTYNAVLFHNEENGKNVTISTNTEGGLRVVYTNNQNRVINEYLIKEATKKEGLCMIGKEK
jgi:hypothetical protein